VTLPPAAATPTATPAAAATSAVAPAAAVAAPAPAAQTAASAQPAAIPPLPEIPRRRSRASAGARAISGLFKAIAIIIWIVAAVILGLAVNTIIQAGPTTLDGFINQLVAHSSTITVIVGFVVGLAFFGFGVVISLLNDIRRNIR
jgi:hypothetical protein